MLYVIIALIVIYVLTEKELNGNSSLDKEKKGGTRGKKSPGTTLTNGIKNLIYAIVIAIGYMVAAFIAFMLFEYALYSFLFE